MKTTHLAEYLIYSNYIPYKLRQEIFPVPDKGGEYTDENVPPMDIFKEESDEKDEYGWTPPAWKEELAEKCKNIGKNPSTEKEFFEKILDEICKYELYDDILHVIHKLSLANNPCFHCVWLKHKIPGKIINCTGIPKLCTMKYDLFAAWPPELYKESEMMTRILICDTLQRYAEFMNEIFNVKYIERAVQLKAIVDCQIMGIHPHMAKIIAKYDLLMYRYYSPVWNRNAEGKLELEEKEEGGDDEDDDYEEDDEEDGKYEDQNGKDELDIGGLEKGEGVEIVVLKMVAKFKNKKEKDEEEKEQEEEKEKEDKEEENEKEEEK